MKWINNKTTSKKIYPLLECRLWETRYLICLVYHWISTCKWCLACNRNSMCDNLKNEETAPLKQYAVIIWIIILHMCLLPYLRVLLTITCTFHSQLFAFACEKTLNSNVVLFLSLHPKLTSFLNSLRSGAFLKKPTL